MGGAGALSTGCATARAGALRRGMHSMACIYNTMLNRAVHRGSHNALCIRVRSYFALRVKYAARHGVGCARRPRRTRGGTEHGLGAL